MKKTIHISLIAISIIAFNACSKSKAENNAASNEMISFYDVPLVCPAAPEIGCGSKAKPVLIEMEKNSEIKEAWLNRAGTVYAIVWTFTDKTDKIAKPTFEKYKIDFKKLNGKETKKLLSSFRENGKWYRKTEVDKLSIEEAGVIANDAVTFAQNEKLINEKEADVIKVEIENYLKTELVKTRTIDELNSNDATNKFKNNLSEIVAKIVGKERADKITELYWQTRLLEKTKQKSCCDKKTEKNAGCKKKSL